jgi:leader peptidase (prepilin peptidase)/N-methyltransferase
VELASAALFVGASLAFESLYLAALMACFFDLMLAVAVIDARFRIVPNRLVYPAMLLFGVAILIGDVAGADVDAPRAALGMLTYSLPFFLLVLALPHGLGMGDAKLVAIIGLVLGSLGLAYVAVAAGVGIVAAGVGAVVALVALGYGRKQQMPFGPFLAAGGVVAALAGPRIASAYLSFFG